MKFYSYWILIVGLGVNFALGRDFSYNGQYGPAHWAEEYSTCNGKHQSPININQLNVEEKLFPKMVFENFEEKPTDGLVINNGHTAIVRFEYRNERAIPKVSYGPLGTDVYSFTQLHFHWGQNSLEGSEDRINNHSFPAELHMVFSNIAYPSFDEAVKHDRGVTVLAFFFEIDETRVDMEYQVFSALLDDIRKPLMSVKYPKPPSLFELMPADLFRYFTYIGSLTTPPCSEDVIWIDFVAPIHISEQQLQRFRNLTSVDGEPLNYNYRPIQPLNNRKVYYQPDWNDLQKQSSSSANNASWSSKNVCSFQNCFAILLCVKYFFLNYCSSTSA